MAFISEIHYRTGDVNVSDSSTYEFVEVTLAPGEDPADFVVSFYGNDGALMNDAADNIQATGVVDGEVTLSDLTGVPDPDNSGYTIYTITATSAVHELVNATSIQVSDEANYIALTNTATSVVEDAIGIGSNGSTALSGGAADGAITTRVGQVGSGRSVQFDIDGNNISGPRTPNDSEVPCFALGTRIAVPGGTRLVDDLAVGDRVMTRDHGPQQIKWIGRKKVSFAELEENPKLLPVRIPKGSLGLGMPLRDLIVSRQHRMLTSSPAAKRLFDEAVSLVAAIKLTRVPGIYVDTEVREVTYVHILLERHEVIFAEGAPTESLYLGDQALSAIGPEAKEEILALFPELEMHGVTPEPAAYLPSNKHQKSLVAWHVESGFPLMTSALL